MPIQFVIRNPRAGTGGGAAGGGKTLYQVFKDAMTDPEWAAFFGPLDNGSGTIPLTAELVSVLAVLLPRGIGAIAALIPEGTLVNLNMYKVNAATALRITALLVEYDWSE